jgi:hypothetical protein
MRYKDENGNVLYGFSQENLEKTNKEIKKTNFLLQLAIALMCIFLAMAIGFAIWLDTNNIFNQLIG